MITHVVFFKLPEEHKDKVQELRQTLAGLDGKIPELKSIEVGVDVLHSARSYDVALITRFDSMADLDAYQIHPEHQKVIQYIQSVQAASAAVDFED
jgi:hypothetical protein